MSISWTYNNKNYHAGAFVLWFFSGTVLLIFPIPIFFQLLRKNNSF
ncbi:hypothetical protein HMPREF1152_1175 [Mogibacterium sp. CM50]|uniref:Uncharacterized protein n=1 Tax=Mogibacterium timidum ATCC 33093 TaxID=1401079 RepID=X8IPT5_9FIRM|nr:hypothetical protein HMPREF1152_1175 [Mogibacterium sp. CM50]EUC51637.1 hypothetical protein HMPREF0581_0069 [Mogibacterium timidum ATCC 33093]